MTSVHIKEEFSETFRSKTLERIKREVKEELISEEEEGRKEMNLVEYDAIKKFLIASNVRKSNVVLMSKVFKVLPNLEAVFGAETDLAKKAVEDLKGQLREKESDLEYTKNLLESVCATLKEK